MKIIDVMTKQGATKSEVRRLLAQGAIAINGLVSMKEEAIVKKGDIIHIGKKSYVAR